MKLYIFAIRDQATDSFDRPMFMVSPGQMLRAFQDEVNRESKDNPMFVHPGDYALWSLGEFDTDNGLFRVHAPEQVALAKDVLIKRN